MKKIFLAINVLVFIFIMTANAEIKGTYNYDAETCILSWEITEYEIAVEIFVGKTKVGSTPVSSSGHLINDCGIEPGTYTVYGQDISGVKYPLGEIAIQEPSTIISPTAAPSSTAEPEIWFYFENDVITLNLEEDNQSDCIEALDIVICGDEKKASFFWITSDAGIASVYNNEISLYNSGTVTLTAILMTNRNIYDSIRVNVVDGNDIVDDDYEIYNGVLTAYNGTEAEIIIPEGVHTIGAYAFENKTNITSVKMSNDITSINDHAFLGCSNLISVNIPENVTSIGAQAFANCHNLSSINIPDKITSIGIGAFSGCCSLDNIKIPETISYIGEKAFHGCNNLSSINIPHGITSIGEYTFCDCRSLTNVSIPTSVTSIGYYAFSNCTGLTSISLPVSTIDAYAFYGCRSLTNITFHQSSSHTATIYESAFMYCSSLADISIPKYVTSIEKSAFYGCTKLETVSIPDTVTYIGDWAFASCRDLSNVYFYGDDLPVIGTGAFDGSSPTIHCKKASDIDYWAEGQGYERKYIDVIPDTCIILPSSINVIEAEAFMNTDVEKVVIPDGCTTIGSKAFADCADLVVIYMPDSVTSIATSAFDGCYGFKFVCESNNYAVEFAETHDIYWEIE